MNVVSIDAWRLPGCGDECAPRRHDPEAHEQYGRYLERAQSQPRVIKTGRMVVDLDALTVFVSQREIALPDVERRIVLALARRAGQIVPAPDLVTAVWGAEYAIGGRRMWGSLLQTNLCRLRANLGPVASLIETIRCSGYRLGIVSPGKAVGPFVSPRGPLERWARDWDHCQFCHTTERPHKARGLCRRCADRQYRAGKFI